jgi:septal ring factor EnvC (AmiA/AmiB activator)
MTQAIDTSEVLKQLDKLTTGVEGIQSDIQKIYLSQAKTEEKLSSIDQRLERLEKRVDAQDSRLWTFVAGAFLTVLGFLAKYAFFPGGQA